MDKILYFQFTIINNLNEFNGYSHIILKSINQLKSLRAGYYYIDKIESSEKFFSAVNNKVFLILNKIRHSGDMWFYLIDTTLNNYQAFVNANEKDHLPFKKIF